MRLHLPPHVSKNLVFGSLSFAVGSIAIVYFVHKAIRPIRLTIDAEGFARPMTRVEYYTKELHVRHGKSDQNIVH